MPAPSIVSPDFDALRTGLPTLMEQQIAAANLDPTEVQAVRVICERALKQPELSIVSSYLYGDPVDQADAVARITQVETALTIAAAAVGQARDIISDSPGRWIDVVTAMAGDRSRRRTFTPEA